jgi:hypothetical protein
MKSTPYGQTASHSRLPDQRQALPERVSARTEFAGAVLTSGTTTDIWSRTLRDASVQSAPSFNNRAMQSGEDRITSKKVRISLPSTFARAGTRETTVASRKGMVLMSSQDDTPRTSNRREGQQPQGQPGTSVPGGSPRRSISPPSRALFPPGNRLAFCQRRPIE